MKNHFARFPALGKLIAVVFCLSLSPRVSALEWYVAQTSQGTGDGTSSGNAKAVSFASTQANWGTLTSQIDGTRDRLHLVGTLTSQLIIWGGGNSGHPFVVLFESGAKLSKAAWDTSGAIQVATNLSYITIDGGATGIIRGRAGDSGVVNGIIECTANGTGLANTVDCWGINAPEQKHFTVQNLAIYNLYVRTRGNGADVSNTVGIAMQDANGNGQSNLLITNCLIHDAYVGVSFDFGIGDSNYEMSYCGGYNCNWNGALGSRGVGCTHSGLLVHDNYFHDWINWDQTIANNYHHNGFYAQCDGGGVITDPHFYNNSLGPGWGSAYQSSGLFISGSVSGTQFYDNIFVANSGEYAAGGFIYGGSGTSTGVHRVYNNTFITNAPAGGAAININAPTTLTVEAKNNIYVGTGSGTFISNYYNTATTLTADYNICYNAGATPFIYSSTGSGSPVGFSSWQSAGFDAHGSSSTPNLDGNYYPVATSSAIGAGFDLSAYFATDYAGASWVGGWGIGALKVAGVSVPAIPTNYRKPRTLAGAGL